MSRPRVEIQRHQIFLQSDLFFSGVRPAINVGISVSRVGGSAQIKAMKKVAGTLRIELAQYREMAAFAQFASDLDKVTRRQLDKGARLIELLKQGQYKPLSVEQQVLSLFVGTADEGFLMDIPVAAISRFEAEMLEFIESRHPEIAVGIRETKDLSPDLRKSLAAAITEFKGFFKAE